jgi:Phosphorylase superfamily
MRVNFMAADYNIYIDAAPPLIFTALELEAAAITRRLAAANLRIPVQVIGIRARYLPANLADPGVPCVLMAGLAGGLDPALRIGDLVWDDPHGLAAGLPGRRGLIHTADRPIATPAEKAALFHAKGALAVEMENAVVRAACERGGLRFIGLRCISDTAADAIDAQILTLMDDRGRTRPLAAAKLVARRPHLVPALTRLGAQSRQAADALAAAVLGLVEKLNSSAAAEVHPPSR